MPSPSGRSITRAEEGASANSDWLGDALCYAVLAGSQPEIAAADAAPSLGKPIAALRAQLEIQRQSHDEEGIRFDDAARESPRHRVDDDLYA